MNIQDLMEKSKKQSTAIYLAVNESVADDISGTLKNYIEFAKDCIAVFECDDEIKRIEVCEFMKKKWGLE